MGGNSRKGEKNILQKNESKKICRRYSNKKNRQNKKANTKNHQGRVKTSGEKNYKN